MWCSFANLSNELLYQWLFQLQVNLHVFLQQNIDTREKTTVLSKNFRKMYTESGFYDPNGMRQ